MHSDKWYFYWQKTAFYLLILHGIYGTWDAVKFLFVEYPKLNQQLELHQISAQEVNQVVITAIVLSLVTVLSLVLAARLKTVSKSLSTTIDLIAATVLLLAGSFMSRFLLRFDIFESFAAWINTILQG